MGVRYSLQSSNGMRWNKRHKKRRIRKPNLNQPKQRISFRRYRKSRSGLGGFHGISAGISRFNSAVGVMGSAKHPSLKASYDRKVDVLHISLGVPVAAEGEGHQGGIELRYAMRDDHPCGAAVIGYSRNNW